MIQILQRALAEYRRTGNHSMRTVDALLDSKDSYVNPDASASGVGATSQTSAGVKRKYRRHPKVRPPDPAHTLPREAGRRQRLSRDVSVSALMKT
jgi:hypothetical protein